MKDATCILVMDDFFDDLKDAGSKVYHGLRDFYQDNKHIVHPLISNLVSRIHPAAATLFDAATTAFGGKIKSEDPYAIDPDYLQCLFGLGPAAPCPRK